MKRGFGTYSSVSIGKNCGIYLGKSSDGEDVLKEPLPAYLFLHASVETKTSDDAPIIETQEVKVENEVAVVNEVDDVALAVSEIIA